MDKEKTPDRFDKNFKQVEKTPEELAQERHDAEHAAADKAAKEKK